MKLAVLVGAEVTFWITSRIRKPSMATRWGIQKKSSFSYFCILGNNCIPQNISGSQRKDFREEYIFNRRKLPSLYRFSDASACFNAVPSATVI